MSTLIWSDKLPADALAPPTHNATRTLCKLFLLHPELYLQLQRADMKVECESYKWILFPARLPLGAKVHFSGSDKQPTLSPIITLTLDIRM